jgi:hypothetical protein
MESDRELLELAAKAIRLNRAQYYYRKPDSRLNFPAVECITYYVDGDPCMKAWLPLQSDGDALRLAVKLLMEIDTNQSGIAVRTSCGHKILITEDEIDDQCAATRRAIVRAAAAIGRSMP